MIKVFSEGNFKQENYKETIYSNHDFLLASGLILGNEIYGRNSLEIFLQENCSLPPQIISVTGTICSAKKNSESKKRNYYYAIIYSCGTRLMSLIGKTIMNRNIYFEYTLDIEFPNFMLQIEKFL